MVKRKLKHNQRVSDDEIGSERPLKQYKKQNSITEIYAKNISLSSDEDIGLDSDNSNLPDTSYTAVNDSYYESFSSFMKAFSFDAESDGEYQKSNNVSQMGSKGSEIFQNNGKGRKSLTQGLHNTSYEEMSEDELETNIRLLSFPFKNSEVVLLQHPASLTLHGYVKVSVCLGSISIFGVKVREGENINVLSTEGTGLKQAVTLKSVHKSTMKILKRKLGKILFSEAFDIDKFIENVGPTSVVLHISRILLPTSLQVLQLYYPSALQSRWPKSENIEENSFKLSSTEQSFIIDISDDFKMISREITENANQTDNANFGSRILVLGNANMGKSTLIRYLMNSSLNKNRMVYFLDTDPGQTEYTPPGVVSLVRVTKPLLGPPFTHQKKPLKMIFFGSINPATSPGLYEKSISCLMKYFIKNFSEQTLFVNTMGWNKGVGALCIQSIRDIVKPTIVIEIVSPEPNLSLTKEVYENGVTYFKAPSKVPPKESDRPSYNSKELRNFSLVAYLGQCQKPYMPVTLINSFQPIVLCWDNIALYVMGKKVPPQCLVEAMHCSMVALCRVDLSYMLTSDNPALPSTLSDDPVCECLGFGLVRASDEANHLFYIVTPFTEDQLIDVNALIKGNIVIPDEIFLKQTIQNKPLAFTVHSQAAKTPASRTPCRRAFHRSFNET